MLHLYQYGRDTRNKITQEQITQVFSGILKSTRKNGWLLNDRGVEIAVTDYSLPDDPKVLSAFGFDKAVILLSFEDEPVHELIFSEEWKASSIWEPLFRLMSEYEFALKFEPSAVDTGVDTTILAVSEMNRPGFCGDPLV